VLQLEDVKPNTASINAAAPADSGGASSSGAAEPKAKAKAEPKAKAKAATNMPEATPEPKAKGRPRKTTPEPDAPPKLKYDFALAKKFEIKRLIANLNKAQHDSAMSMLDATLFGNKIKQF